MKGQILLRKSGHQKRTNAQVYAPDREKEVYERVSAKNKGPLSDKCLLLYIES